ncbi:MAG: LysM peptidoglycan-binding domain-containing protein [Litorimonas sp.]
MRAFLILPLSAALLSGCLTSQENPNYEISSQYQGDLEARHQYANAAPVASTGTTYEAAPLEAVTVQANTVEMTTAPTDSLYGVREVSGTPGFMAMESDRQAIAIEAAAQAMPEAEIVTSAPLGAAGTPIAYDYTRNLVSIDAVTTGQQIPDTVRVLPSAGQTYTVQQGDTVYSLSRKTCVGVNVIQSMNGLSADYAIKIGQSLTLPTSVC